jgi:signal recognition particle receptor subunit beta
MVFFNYSTMQMAAKVVYYGPGLCGKTTNLHYIYGHTTQDSRGEMVSLETETDRTLFFDLLPLDVGSIAGFNTRIQLYTVPGQVFYNTTRKLVLKGVDGVVFVVDSQRAMLQANLDSFRNLEENLGEMGLAVDSLPLVLQYNKRDLADIYSVEELNQAINRHGWPVYETSAVSGQGVFETLKGISKYTLLALKKRLGRTGADAPARLSAPTAAGASPATSAAGAAGAAASLGQAPPAPQAANPSSAAGLAPAAAATPSATAAASPSAPVPSPSPSPAAATTPARPVAAGAAAPQAGAASPPAPGVPAGPDAPGAQPSSPAAPAGTAASPAAGVVRSSAKRSSGKSRSFDVLSELEKLRREAMQPAHPATSTPPTGQPARTGSLAASAAPSRSARSSGAPPAPGRPGAPPASPASPAGGGAGPSPAKTASSNGRAELSRNIEMTLKRSDFARARRILLSFQVEDEQHRVVDAVHDLPVEIKDTADLEKLLLRFNIALHAKE